MPKSHEQHGNGQDREKIDLRIPTPVTEISIESQPFDLNQVLDYINLNLASRLACTITVNNGTSSQVLSGLKAISVTTYSTSVVFAEGPFTKYRLDFTEAGVTLRKI